MACFTLQGIGLTVTNISISFEYELKISYRRRTKVIYYQSHYNLIYITDESQLIIQ